MDNKELIADDVWDFLMGVGPLEGCQFGERHPTRKGAFWWRSVIRERSAMLQNEAAQTIAAQDARIAELEAELADSELSLSLYQYDTQYPR